MDDILEIHNRAMKESKLAVIQSCIRLVQLARDLDEAATFLETYHNDVNENE